MIDAIRQFRKKYTLAMLMFIAGTTLAFVEGSTLLEYSTFCGVLLAIFGAADLVDKDKFRRNGNE